MTPYVQVDLNPITPVKHINGAKDLEKEAKIISETLMNKKNDWSKRLKCIQVLQSCFVTHELLALPQIYTFLSKITEALSQQLFDLRSTITKEACKTISLIAEVL